MKINRVLFLLLFILSIVVISCSSGSRISKKGCGCGVHKGYVGY